MRTNKALQICAILLFFISNSANAAMLGDVTLFANSLNYDQQTKILHAKQNVTLFSPKYTIAADEITYDTNKETILAKGNIKIHDGYGNIITGTEMLIDNEFKKGVINDITVRFSNKISILASSQAKKFQDDQTQFEYSCYTACSTSQFQNPIWQIKAEHSTLNHKKETITYKNVYFEVFGMPVFFLPYFTHPTPKAKAKSGLLAPNLDTKNLKLPLYFRPKPNLDFTVTPRIVPQNTIIEGEFRHLINQGQYQLNGSAASNKVQSTPYHLFGNGTFDLNNIKLGFNLKRTSDPAYLRKYYDIYDPYLASNIYAEKIEYANYTKIEALFFQDMRAEKLLEKDPVAAPFIKVKRVYDLDYQTYFTVDSNNLFYKSGKEYEAIRSSNIVNLSKSFEIQNNIINLNLYNKIDLYKFDYNVHGPLTNSKQNTSFINNNPELHTYWRYPIITNYGLIIEPVILNSTSLTKYKARDIIPTDSEKEFELNDLNLLYHNRFSGRDNQENGHRLSYGLNVQKIDQSTYSLFLGRNHSKSDKKSIVGNASVSNSTTDIYYRFNLENNLAINMHELGTKYTVDKLDFSTTIFEMKQKSPFMVNQSKISNLINKINYRLNENWAVHFDTVVDLSENPSTLLRGFGVTYEYDCVRISAKISDNFTYDSSRNIKKSKSNISVKIGLKTLNM